MNYFDSFVDVDSNITYTVDMLRCSTKIQKISCDGLVSWLNQFITSKENYWNDSGFGKFSHNWKIGCFWLGLGTRTKHETSTLNFTFEFNPNKMSTDDFFFFLGLSKLLDYSFYIIRLDLACDIPYNINDLKIINLNKRSYSIFYHNYNDKTIYFGKRDGHTKIYNKKIEANLNFELTRIEVTKYCYFHISSPELISFNFPELSFEEFTYDGERNDTYDAIQHALNSGFPYTSLSRTYRSKFSPYLRKLGQLEDSFANKAIDSCLRKLRKWDM